MQFSLHLNDGFEFFFLRQCAAQQPRHKVSDDCLITRSISMNLMPEMVSLSVLQHQMPKFHIKHGKFQIETIHIPSLHPSLSVPFEDFHHNPRITEINSLIDAKPAPD